MKGAMPSSYTTAPPNPPSFHYGPNTGISENFVDHSQGPISGSNVVNMDNSSLKNTSSNLAGPIELYENGNFQSRLEHLKHWSVTTFKCTKQMIEEKLGTANITVDEELEDRISVFRNMHQQYRILHNLAEKLANSFRETIRHQRAFTNHMAALTVQQPELSSEFTYNTETQRIVISNGEKLLDAASERYSQLKKVVSCKLEFLQENRLRVMQHQLVLLQNATSAFFSGNNQQLDQILNQYKIKLSSPQNGAKY
ncbi:Arfaptin-1 [Schistosoma japonicum]|nr:Arfaptin-1 [Schistosoma japonicum]KAH8852893.1 Arfaptin-1 [Schistosoma japonicum]